jgi:hypothetical protein
MNTEERSALLSLGCQTLREGVVATLIFFIAGVSFILVAIYIVPDIWHLQHITMFVGFILLLLAPIILISTFLLSSIAECQKESG